PVAPRERGYQRLGDARHAGERLELLLYAVEERARAGVVVAVERRREREGDEVVHTQAEAYLTDIAEALHEQTGGDEQRQGERDLRRDERGAEAGGGASAGVLAGAVADRRREIGFRAVEGGEETEEDSRSERERGREEHGGSLQ